LRVAAERAYRDTEERLQLELQETERRLGELQAAKGEGDLTIISDEQQAEIQRFMDRRCRSGANCGRFSTTCSATSTAWAAG
jgi:hypothetical protein